MQIVIDITEEDYNDVIQDTFSGTPFENRVFSAVANATPLPNGHGDLKDIETFKLTYGNDGAYYRFKDIIDAPTIIEADKGEE